MQNQCACHLAGHMDLLLQNSLILLPLTKNLSFRITPKLLGKLLQDIFVFIWYAGFFLSVSCLCLIADMGFGWGISKVCRGKPANQSIMTVIFHGTFSGLKEAERLHKLYAENKHGRAEFQQINCSSGETKKAPLDKVKDVLYGYLGIAGDLDKLDFETKSCALVKSKKEIYATADALLNIE